MEDASSGQEQLFHCLEIGDQAAGHQEGKPSSPGLYGRTVSEMPAISILTPTWNRADYLRRVWTSLSAQTSRDFEWIVADDGSSDGTGEIVRALAERSSFPILYLRSEAHVGKARMDNEAIRRARGEFILWCDSDDWLEPHAVERLLSVWQSIDEGDRAQFLGVTALAATEDGVIFNPFRDLQQVDLKLNDMAEVKSAATDMMHMARTDLLRANPFPEVDLVVPESAVWSVVCHCPSRLISEVLLRKEYRRASRRVVQRQNVL